MGGEENRIRPIGLSKRGEGGGKKHDTKVEGYERGTRRPSARAFRRGGWVRRGGGGKPDSAGAYLWGGMGGEEIRTLYAHRPVHTVGWGGAVVWGVLLQQWEGYTPAAHWPVHTILERENAYRKGGAKGGAEYGSVGIPEGKADSPPHVCGGQHACAYRGKGWMSHDLYGEGDGILY